MCINRGLLEYVTDVLCDRNVIYVNTDRLCMIPMYVCAIDLSFVSLET
jgi:hypothetical protein